MTTGKKYFFYRVYAMIDIKVFPAKRYRTTRDIQVIVVSEDSSQAAGKKYVTMINRSKMRRLIKITKIEKMK